MKLFRHHILPWFMESGLTRPELQGLRQAALRPAGGTVLEIGFGVGASLAGYPRDDGRVRAILALEPNPGMLKRAASRLADSPVAPHVLRGVAGALPFADASVDTVVTQWTLCSLPDLPLSLREIRRVLRPGGRFLFLEHGLCDDPRVARRQHRLAPLFRLVGDGCRPFLAIDRTIAAAGFSIENLDRPAPPRAAWVLGPLYLGMARP